ncbi:hypothetical protein PanWU01x14_357390 [Parasponia andersonii]|uniref:Uncharacterized protein n=1 Tax=Parasponia andersonii TaxID=3476 RepID=A0A2P5A8K8_PARAD|nr:hypothetical protein PanWU01x14_357390 [Parasponia andersonii]
MLFEVVGWFAMVSGRSGQSFNQMRCFVLESRLLDYYKRKPQDNQVGLQFSIW